MKRALYSLIFLVFALAIPAHGNTLYSNFGPGNTYQNSGWFIGAGNFLGDAGWTYAMPFSPITSGSVDSINLAAIWFSGIFGTGPNLFDVTLAADSSGYPGAALESFTSVPLSTDITSLSVFNSTTHPALGVGTQYWVILSAVDPLNTAGAWLKPPNSPKGLTGYSVWGSPFTVYRDEISAFSVEGTSSVPEPQTFALLSAGLLIVLAARLRSRTAMGLR